VMGMPASIEDRFARAGVPASARSIRYEPGERGDYQRLARFHYRDAPPATFATVRRAVDDELGITAGVLVVSYPTLNSAWRDLAWPGRYSSGDKRERAQRINRELRCISRVIVEPRFRAMGIARELVRRYLDAPLTAATEAHAAMGEACPFLARAGMVEYRPGPSHAASRLIDALAWARVEPWMLLDPGNRTAPGPVTDHPVLARELRIWARADRVARRHADADSESLALLAARRIGCSARVYAHTFERSEHAAEGITTGTPMGRTTKQRSTSDDAVPRPREPQPAHDQIHPLTFMLTDRERRAVLARLGARRLDRARALLAALGIDPRGQEEGGHGASAARDGGSNARPPER